MGTRSLTVFVEDGKEFAVMYRQMDGYPNGGHGQELAEFLAGRKIVNGISMADGPRIANGMGCLAAQVVAHFKDEPGSIYLMAPGTRAVWEEFIYRVSGGAGDVEANVEVLDGDEKTLFSGPASNVLEWCKKYVEDQA